MTPLMDVDYDETRFVLHRDEDWTTGNVVGMFLRKSSDWIYEGEVRMFARSSVASYFPVQKVKSRFRAIERDSSD